MQGCYPLVTSLGSFDRCIIWIPENWFVCLRKTSRSGDPNDIIEGVPSLGRDSDAAAADSWENRVLQLAPSRLADNRPGAGQVGRCTRGGRRQTDLKRDKELLFSQLNANSIYGGEFESDIDRPGETICQRGLARDTCRARMTPHMCINYSGAINAVITRRWDLDTWKKKTPRQKWKLLWRSLLIIIMDDKYLEQGINNQYYLNPMLFLNKHQKSVFFNRNVRF
jgi:hypothetical protein